MISVNLLKTHKKNPRSSKFFTLLNDQRFFLIFEANNFSDNWNNEVNSLFEHRDYLIIIIIVMWSRGEEPKKYIQIGTAETVKIVWTTENLGFARISFEREKEKYSFMSHKNLQEHHRSNVVTSFFGWSIIKNVMHKQKFLNRLKSLNISSLWLVRGAHNNNNNVHTHSSVQVTCMTFHWRY